MDSLDTINRKFLDLMAKEVTANIGGKVVVTSNYELFLGEMIKSGIKGNTQARKLVLDFLIAAMEREGCQKTPEPAPETDGEPAEVFSWDSAKKQLLKAAGPARLNRRHIFANHGYTCGLATLIHGAVRRHLWPLVISASGHHLGAYSNEKADLWSSVYLRSVTLSGGNCK
jgi:hypothetical protein